MKRIGIVYLMVCVICSFVTSCTPMRYMQIATIESEQVKIQSDGLFKSESPEFIVEYNFWSEYGDMGFLIRNNSDKDLYLNLEKSYFINNGYAHDYYQNRIFVYSNKSLSYSTYFENGNTVEYIEDKIVCIPAHSVKYFEEFHAISDVYRECGFPRNPSKKEEAILEFTEEDSPKVFENRLMFVIDDKEIPVNHKFYVCKIQNILEDKVYERKYRKDCDGNEIIRQY